VPRLHPTLRAAASAASAVMAPVPRSQLLSGRYLVQPQAIALRATRHISARDTSSRPRLLTQRNVLPPYTAAVTGESGCANKSQR